jgi:hypothetical protein
LKLSTRKEVTQLEKLSGQVYRLALHTEKEPWERKRNQILMIAAVTLSLALMPLSEFAQRNNNTSTGQMKQSGSEVGRAGRSMGHNVKHGRILRGGKYFGKHMGQAGKHFGRGTKKAVKRAVS